MSRTVPPVLLIVLLKCWTAVCSGISNGSMLPDDPYVLIGDNLTLTCSHYTKDNTSLIILGQHDQKFPPEYLTEVSPHVLQLNLPIKNESWQGRTINCFDDSDFNFNSGQILKVEYPPRNMTNVTTLIDNWKTLNISWSIPKYLDMANIEVDVKWKTLNGWYNCSEGSSITNCFLNETYFLECPVYWFRINITNTKADVSHVQDVRIQSNRYVRSAPPEGLFPTTSSRCLTATWDKIPYRPHTWAYTVHHDNMTISRGEVDNPTVTICKLRPDTEYVLSVTSKPIASIYWSLPSRITNRTAEDKPDAGAPVMDGGYYVKNPCKGGRRTIVIFLTTPSRNTWNGILTKFKVSYFLMTGRKEKTKVIPVTSLNDTIDIKCAAAYTVEITLYNRIGASPTSKLRIPVHEAVSRPTRVRVRISRETGELEWSKKESVRSQAVFWCQGTLIPFSCKGRTQWKSVQETDNSTSITYATGNIYGVSITTDKGSSDIAWADCTYILEKEPSRITQLFSADNVPNKNSLTVRWNPETCSDNVLVTHYIIEHCDVNNITACVTNMVRSEDGQYTIPDLKAGVNYSVRLRKVTVDGKEGEFSDQVYATPLFPDFSTGVNPQQKRIWTLGAILGLLGFLAIIIAVVRFRKLKLNEPIDMPKSDQALDNPTKQAFIPSVVVEENVVDPIKKAPEKLMAQENRPDSGFSSGSSPKEAHSAETHFSSESGFKWDSVGSCGGSKIIKEERASECHDEEEDTSEQVNVWYSIVAGRDDEQEERDEEEEANQDDEDQSNVDAEEPDNFYVEDKGNMDDDESILVAINLDNLDSEDRFNLGVEDRDNLDSEDRFNLGVEDRDNLDSEDRFNLGVEDRHNLDSEDRFNLGVEHRDNLDDVDRAKPDDEEHDEQVHGDCNMVDAT